MADDQLARRREIRRRKILDGSEARLNKITSSLSFTVPNGEKEVTEKKCHVSSMLPLTTSDSCLESEAPVNGCSQNERPYTFPKKVSDAENRSFSKTRCDARRNSFCTQMILHTFKFSFLNCDVLRPWLALLTACTMRLYVYLMAPTFKTIYFPFMMLELAFFAWSHLEYQKASSDKHLFSGLLLLCGISDRIVSKLNSMWNFTHHLWMDLTFYTFSFVVSHLVSVYV